MNRLVWALPLALTLLRGATAQMPPAAADDARAHAGGLSRAFTDAASRARPAVVAVVNERAVGRGLGPFGGLLGGAADGGGMQPQGQGSGVVVVHGGERYVLTNNHVIEGADHIRVVAEGGTPVHAEVVGADPQTDLAVLRVDLPELSAIEAGDSDALRVGQWVLAIGNPFGLHHSVTAGIVSAVGRGHMGLAEYEDFIQTDAAINPGNSGGALVDLDGRLVGINTAMVSRAGGYQGIGFAIPVNMARRVLDQLVTYGRVRRGWLGVHLRDLTSLQARQLGLADRQGTLVERVVDEGPAQAAGLQAGDVVLRAAGRPVANGGQLRNEMALTPAGSRVELVIWRGGREQTLGVELGELPAPATGARQPGR